MKNVDNYIRSGLEAAIRLGALSLQAEYIQAWFFRYGEEENEAFDGGYASISWLLSPYPRPYSIRSGTFGKINSQLKNIWEVAVRRSFLDLNSRTGTVSGGRQANTTWAVNFHFNKALYGFQGRGKITI